MEAVTTLGAPLPGAHRGILEGLASRDDDPLLIYGTAGTCTHNSSGLRRFSHMAMHGLLCYVNGIVAQGWPAKRGRPG